jgi:transcriptional regulator with XRE-family HTH domain
MWYIIVNMQNLRKLRLKKHLSQEKLAEISGVSRTTIIAIEKGKHPFQPLTLQKVADALGVDPTEVNNDGNA